MHLLWAYQDDGFLDQWQSRALTTGRMPLQVTVMNWQKVRWVQSLLTFECPVVWVDVQKIDRAWAKDGLYIGPGGIGDNQPIKYDRVGKWIAEFHQLEMCIASLTENDVVAFTDGRHRFAWLRDHGAEALPIAADPADEREMRARFETQERECRFRTLTL